MEAILGLVILLILFGLFAAPILFAKLFKRQRELESRLQAAERQLRVIDTVSGEPRSKSAESRVQQPAAVIPEAGTGSPEKPAEPPTKEVSPVIQKPESGTGSAASPDRSLPPELPAPVAKAALVQAEEENAPESESELLLWLDKVGLRPPSVSDESTNAMAWWSTRIGLALGVIAAVFLGMHVNQNTVPWVRFLQLAITAVAVFVAGNFFERKVPAFGRALSAGGLGLLFVVAFAAYGLPAMKVIETPQMGSLAQGLVLALIVAWSLWKNREAVFGLALVLGYVTCWFSVAEGLPSVSLIAFVLLSAAGSLLFAQKGWWSGLWTAVLGSGFGFAIQSFATRIGDTSPAYGMVLALAVSFTLFPLLSLSRRWLAGEARIRRVVPIVTSIGVLTSGVAVVMRGFELEPFYLTFAALLLLAGWWWRRDESEGIWQTLWSKAMVLVALYLIARFEGPTRAFSLFAQAGTLVWLGRTRQRPIFEWGALSAFVVGACFLVPELNEQPLALWWSAEWALLLYFLGGELLLFAYRRLTITEETPLRRHAGAFFSGGLTVAFLLVALSEVNPQIAPLVAWIFGGLVLALNYKEPLTHRMWPPFLILMATLGGLVFSDLGTDATTWWLAAWLVLAAGYFVWMSRGDALVRGLQVPAAMFSLLWMSLFAVYGIVDVVLDDQWRGSVFLAVALGWALLGRVIQPKGFTYSSLLPALVGTVLTASLFLGPDGAPNRLTVSIFCVSLVSLWWAVSRRNMGQLPKFPEMSYLFTSVAGLVLWLVLQLWFDNEGLSVALMLASIAVLAGWRFLREDSCAWLALIYALVSVLGILDLALTFGAAPWSVVVVAIIAAGIGVCLSRPGAGSGVLARPKVASVVWGLLAIVTVMGGFGLGRVANWTTAAWAIGAVALLVCGFGFGLRGYRMIALSALTVTIARLFLIDIDNTLWRILAFGVTGALLLGIGFLYSRYHKRLGIGDLDWKTGTLPSQRASE